MKNNMVIGGLLLTIDIVLFLELWILSCVMIEPMYLYAPGNVRSWGINGD